MQAASRPYVLAAAALAATSAVIAIPLAPRPVQLPVRSIETRLVDADSVLNIPVNLFDDIVNIPYNEVQALDTLADSLLDTGNWWVPSSTNIWGLGPLGLHPCRGGARIVVTIPVAGSRPRRPRLSN